MPRLPILRTLSGHILLNLRTKRWEMPRRMSLQPTSCQMRPAQLLKRCDSLSKTARRQMRHHPQARGLRPQVRLEGPACRGRVNRLEDLFPQEQAVPAHIRHPERAVRPGDDLPVLAARRIHRR